MADRHRTAVEVNGLRSIWLGEALLGMGDRDAARRLVADGLDFCRRRRMLIFEGIGSLAMARIELAAPAAVDVPAVRRHLARVEATVGESGGHLIEPLVHAELAELARHEDDEAGRLRELRRADRLREEMVGEPA